jgi:hypothetical protein
MSRPKSIVAPTNENGQPGREEFPYGANAPVTEGQTEEAGAEQPTPAPPPKPAKWSRENLRLKGTDLAKVLKTETHQNIIPVDKPSAEVWFRVHEDPEYSFDTTVLWLKEGPDKGIYQVLPDIEDLLLDEKRYLPVRLVFCIDRQGEWRIWPLRIPHGDRREDDWMTSALTIVEIAKKQWVKLLAGKSGYQHKTTRADIPDPVWPDRSFDELLDMAFRKRRIDKPDDAVLLRLLEGK